MKLALAIFTDSHIKSASKTFVFVQMSYRSLPWECHNPAVAPDVDKQDLFRKESIKFRPHTTVQI